MGGICTDWIGDLHGLDGGEFGEKVAGSVCVFCFEFGAWHRFAFWGAEGGWAVFFNTDLHGLDWGGRMKNE